ncbi:hypothetical protein C8A00DRAFT_34259 [Chaetomidium leptoderma]|uniref:Uncharacterized protein n=1 Tax=Chaetomidium leptoderma TaxID=669021 RepID=A0AAN6VK20_9PEZI|nr:hypothetical protein C8A00DRAFT_34259 [Chaetomidium leptoderma]
MTDLGPDFERQQTPPLSKATTTHPHPNRDSLEFSDSDDTASLLSPTSPPPNHTSRGGGGGHANPPHPEAAAAAPASARSEIHILSITNPNFIITFHQIASIMESLALTILALASSPPTPLTWLFFTPSPQIRSPPLALSVVDYTLLIAFFLVTFYLRFCLASLVRPVEMRLVPGARVVRWAVGVVDTCRGKGKGQGGVIRGGRIVLPVAGVAGGGGDDEEEEGVIGRGRGKWWEATFTWWPRYYGWRAIAELPFLWFAWYTGDEVVRRWLVVGLVLVSWYLGWEAAEVVAQDEGVKR